MRRNPTILLSALLLAFPAWAATPPAPAKSVTPPATTPAKPAPGPQFLGATLGGPCTDLVKAMDTAGLTRNPTAGPGLNEYQPRKPLPAPLTDAKSVRFECAGTPGQSQFVEVMFQGSGVAAKVKQALDSTYGPTKNGSWRLPGDWALTLSPMPNGARVAYIRTKAGPTQAKAVPPPVAGKDGKPVPPSKPVVAVAPPKPEAGKHAAGQPSLLPPQDALSATMLMGAKLNSSCQEFGRNFDRVGLRPPGTKGKPSGGVFTVQRPLTAPLAETKAVRIACTDASKPPQQIEVFFQGQPATISKLPATLQAHLGPTKTDRWNLSGWEVALRTSGRGASLLYTRPEAVAAAGKATPKTTADKAPPASAPTTAALKPAQVLGVSLKSSCADFAQGIKNVGLQPSVALKALAGSGVDPESVKEFTPARPLPAPLATAKSIVLVCESYGPATKQVEATFAGASEGPKLKAALDQSYGEPNTDGWLLADGWSARLLTTPNGLRLVYAQNHVERLAKVASAPAAKTTAPAPTPSPKGAPKAPAKP